METFWVYFLIPIAVAIAWKFRSRKKPEFIEGRSVYRYQPIFTIIPLIFSLAIFFFAGYGIYFIYSVSPDNPDYRFWTYTVPVLVGLGMFFLLMCVSHHRGVVILNHEIITKKMFPENKTIQFKSIKKIITFGTADKQQMHLYGSKKIKLDAGWIGYEELKEAILSKCKGVEVVEKK